MSDINLPGISSDIDVKGIIDKLVKVESKKLDSLENTKELFNKEKSAWTNLGNKIKDVQDAARSLYGFRSPFDDKIAASSDENILTATVSRIAAPSTTAIKIEQVAQKERIISDPIETSRIFDRLPLKIRVGEKEIEIYFNGGRIENLSDAVNKQAGDFLISKLTGDTKETSVLILESKNTGKKNRISVTDDQTLNFFKEIGLFEEKKVLLLDTKFSSERFKGIEGATEYSLYDDTLILKPKNSVEFNLDQQVIAKPSILLKIELRAVELPREEEVPPLPLPELKDIGKVTVKDIEIEGGRSVAGMEIKKEEKEKAPEIIDDSVLGLRSKEGVKSTVEVEGIGSEFREYEFRFTDIAEEGNVINSILFLNKSTARNIEYKNLVIIDESERPGAAPKHLVQEAQDSIISIDGVRVQRDTNRIDDAIKGVTINIKKEAREDIELSIDRDYEKITGSIVNLIEKYNGLFEFINQQTRVVPSRKPTEKTEAGLLTGDITVMSLKNKLQTIMMNPYPTDKGKELSLLAQIGISMGAINTSWSDIKKGYLQVDEDSFIDAFEKHPESIKQLFGSDKNNDLVIDGGLAFVMEHTLKGYTDSINGIVTYHIKNTDSKITDQEKRIDDWNEHLEDYRRKLKRDFTVMQQALHELEQNQKSLENFSNQFRKK